MVVIRLRMPIRLRHELRHGESNPRISANAFHTFTEST